MFRCKVCDEQPYDGNYCRSCNNSGYADYAAAPCDACNGEPLIRRRAKERSVVALERLVTIQEEISKKLDVLIGARTINSLNNIVPSSEVELFDGSFSAQIYYNNEFQAPMSLNRGSSLFYENTKND